MGAKRPMDFGDNVSLINWLLARARKHQLRPDFVHERNRDDKYPTVGALFSPVKRNPGRLPACGFPGEARRPASGGWRNDCGRSPGSHLPGPVLPHYSEATVPWGSANEHSLCFQPGGSDALYVLDWIGI